MSNHRKIIHIDADCFYAAIEMRDAPSLRNVPLAVGGSSQARGVLSTANYKARMYGVRSAMSTALAMRLCPSLVVVSGNMDKYRLASRQMHAIFRQYTDIIEPLSLDEAYLDVTNSLACQGSATRIAEQIRRQIVEQIGITVSAGVATNKFIAKVASEWLKPDGLTTITPDEQFEFVSQLPVKCISGVGKVAQEKLGSLGVFSCSDLQEVDFTRLQKNFGSMAFRLSQYAIGVDDRPVRVSRERKSISVEHTFSEDLLSVTSCFKCLPELLSSLEQRIVGHDLDLKISKYYLKLKFNDFKQTTVEQAIQSSFSTEIFYSLLQQAYQRHLRPVRLIGIGYRLSSADPSQLTMSFE